MMLWNPNFDRRSFLKGAAALGAGLTFAPYDVLGTTPSESSEAAGFHLFSKHLQFLSYPDMAEAAAAIGFDGVELTVRGGGHVEPENAERDLPKAVEAVRKAGLKAEMMVSDITEVNDLSKRVLETAAEVGIKHYRLGYYDYPDEGSMPEALNHINRQVQELAELNKTLGLVGSYQNHAGGLVGASMWEIWKMLEGANPQSSGCQYDIRHAMVDGGYSWENGLRLVQDRIQTIAIKDYKWGQVDGEWEVINTPLGGGMVDFGYYFKLLKAYGVEVPATLHFEYDLFGAEHGSREVKPSQYDQIYAAMKKDLDNIKKWWKDA